MKPLAVSSGDPAGVGPLLTALLHKRSSHELPLFFLVARAQDVPPITPLTVIRRPEDAVSSFPNSLPVLTPPDSPLDSPDVVPGNPTPTSARLAYSSLIHALSLVQNGHADALITNPVDKRALHDVHPPFHGHTQLLPSLLHCRDKPLMMLDSPSLRVALLTEHIPLSQVSSAVKALGPQGVADVAVVLRNSLIADFLIPRPRIALAALNPHAGDSSLLGDEEHDVLAPAVLIAQKLGVDIHGPLPADALFHKQSRSKFHAILAAYHDQALIPLKTLHFHDAANITLNLPIVRTSPDHGTAFPLAQPNSPVKPSETSLLRALRSARLIADRRSQSHALPSRR